MKVHLPPGLKVVEILLVEDNDADARLVDEAFKSGKISNKLTRVRTGQEALDYLFARGEYVDVSLPDLILLDLNMPKTDGRELLECIKDDKKLSRIPLVVLTSSFDEEDILHSYNNQANCFITKPLEFDKFVDVVKSIEHFWFSVAKIPI